MSIWKTHQRPYSVPHDVRKRTEEVENNVLSSFAARSSESSGRETPEDPDPVRTCFQRDRDRIVHSKAFRRLKHKTQVFIEPFGDHYRTRLTHSLEVSQIARTIGRALRLNEDLIEAIALGHDVGHTPFGHAGESALDEVLRCVNDPLAAHGFQHHTQSLRIVQHLPNLNLSAETLAGISGHSKGRKDLSAADGEATSTLEAAVVRISDRIAYMNHDLDDAVRSGIIPAVPEAFMNLGITHSKRIGTMVEDVILNSLDRPRIDLSPQLMATMNTLKEWLFENVYLKYPLVYPDIDKAKSLVKELFEHFLKDGTLPHDFRGVQGAVDYVAGMTDRFAIETYTRLKMPSGFEAQR